MLERLYIGDAANPSNGGVADDCKTAFPADLNNDFVLSCDFTLDADLACTILESGNVKINYTGTALQMVKGAIIATTPLTAVAGTKYHVDGRVSATNGVDVWLDSVKGAGNADVADAVAGADLQIGATAALAEHINGTIGNIVLRVGSLSDEEVING